MFKVIPFEFLLQMILSIHTLINLSHMRGNKEKKKKTVGNQEQWVEWEAPCFSGFPEVCTEFTDMCHS